MADVRWYAPGVRYYEVVQKCAGDEMLMRPDALTVFLIGVALAIACNQFPGVQVVSFSFVSNHFHLVLYVETDEEALNISDFMKALDQKIAQDLNKLRGRHGHFFRGRPRIIAILDDLHVARRMTYTHTQPVHHGLVERVEEWPGLSSFRAVCDGKSSVDLAYLNDEAWHEAGARPETIADYTQTVSVPVSMPGLWRQLSERELRAARRAHETSVRDVERQEAVNRRHRRLPKGSHYTRIDPFERPKGPVEDKPKPWAHATEEDEKAYREAYSKMLAAYRVASVRFRKTGVLCAFPAGTRPPWIARAPVMT